MPLINDYKEGFFYIFKDQRWISKLWVLVLLTVFPVVNLLSLFLYKGWRFEMVRNLSKGSEELPEFDFIAMFKKGLLLWVVMGLHIFVPGVFLFILGMGSIGLLGIFFDFLTTNSSASDQAVQAGSSIVVSIFVYLIWFVISLPVYQSGMIRYALSGNWKTLFNAPANFLFFVRHIHKFVKFYIYWIIFLGLLFVVDFFLVFTGIGALIVSVLTINAYYISSAHELGKLANQVNKSIRTANTTSPLTDPA